MQYIKITLICLFAIAALIGASDEEYDAMKETVITGIVGNSSNNAVEGTVKVKRIDTPAAKQPEPYQINRDAMD